MVTTRRAPAPPASIARSNSSSQPKYKVKTAPVAPSTALGASDTDTGMPPEIDSLDEPTKKSGKAKLKGKQKKGGKKRKSSRNTFLDFVARIVFIWFTVYSLSVCPHDSDLERPICKALYEYRRLILEPYVFPRVQAALAHPAIAPRIEQARPYVEQVAAFVKPVAVRTQYEWSHRLAPQWDQRVVPYWSKHVTPQLKRAEERIEPCYQRVQHEYARTVEPYVRLAAYNLNRWQHQAQPYIALTAAKTHEGYVKAKPYAIVVWERFIALVYHALALAAEQRKQYVDPHIARIWAQIKESSNANAKGGTLATTSQFLEDAVTSTAPWTSTDAAETAQVKETLSPAASVVSSAATVASRSASSILEGVSLSPSADPASSSVSSLLSTTLSEVSSVVSPTGASAVSVVAEAASSIVSAPSAASSVASSAGSSLSSVAARSSTSASSYYQELSSTVASAAESGASAAAHVAYTGAEKFSSASSAAASLGSQGIESASQDVSAVSSAVVDATDSVDDAASSVASSALSLVSEATSSSSSVAIAVTADSTGDDLELDPDSFLADLGISDDLSSLEAEVDDLEGNSPAPTAHEETEEEKAERIRLEEERKAEKKRQTAEKRANIDKRHTQWEKDLEALVKSSKKELRKALVAVRKAAAAELKTHPDIHARIEELVSEAEKMLRGAEGYLKNLKKEKRKDEEKSALWDRVVEKVEAKFMQKLRETEDVVNTWYGGVEQKELHEVRRVTEEVKSMAGNAQADIGLDYVWLDDVTYTDWQRYHDLVRRSENFTALAYSIQNGTHPSPPANPVLASLHELESDVDDIVKGFETRLRRIKRTGDRTFRSGQTEDAHEDSDIPSEPEVSILPVPDAGRAAEAVKDGSPPIVIGRGKQEVLDALGKVESESVTDALPRKEAEGGDDAVRAIVAQAEEEGAASEPFHGEL